MIAVQTTMACRESRATSSNRCELADIVRRYADGYQRAHKLSTAQYKALRAIRNCRTAALGGHREYCERCGYETYRYHSCRNRHCPKCQSQQREAWVEARIDDLLPVPYFHQVFTIPHQLNPLILTGERNRRALLKLLFDATAETLMSFGRHTFGGKVGFMLLLHTWDQQLRLHVHLHCLIASGALVTAADNPRWVAGGRKFLFPVHGLSKMFRAVFLRGLSALLSHDDLDLPPSLAWLDHADYRRLSHWLPAPWVVYSKPPFAGPKKLLGYLSRYTHRVAISNDRLLSCDDDHVRFTWRDRREGERVKEARIPAQEFLTRFVHHVLPGRFQRIRHYGLIANRGKNERLDQCRRLLGVTRFSQTPRSSPKSSTLADWLIDVLGVHPDRCPCCGGMLHRAVIDPQPGFPVSAISVTPHTYWDTS